MERSNDLPAKLEDRHLAVQGERIQKAGLGEGDAIRLRLFNQYWAACKISVRAYLSALLANPNDIDDCVQEVAVIAWKKGPVAHGERAFLGHCLTSARYIGMATSRKFARARMHHLPEDVALSLADEIVEQELSESAPSARIHALRSCMSRLDDQQRDLLRLRYEESDRKRLSDFAKTSGKTLDAIYKQLERLRTSLLNCVKNRLGPGHETF